MLQVFKVVVGPFVDEVGDGQSTNGRVLAGADELVVAEVGGMLDGFEALGLPDLE